MATIISVKAFTENNDLPACHEYPGAYFICSSQCYPNCTATFDSYYSMQIFLPNKAECHIDTVHYGYFRVYFPTTGIVNGTADYYFSFNGLCFKDSKKNVPIGIGAVYNGYN